MQENPSATRGPREPRRDETRASSRTRNIAVHAPALVLQSRSFPRLHCEAFVHVADNLAPVTHALYKAANKPFALIAFA
jgi:hypothetical protein